VSVAAEVMGVVDTVVCSQWSVVSKAAAGGFFWKLEVVAREGAIRLAFRMLRANTHFHGATIDL
jgi:hypothetical protein